MAISGVTPNTCNAAGVGFGFLGIYISNEAVEAEVLKFKLFCHFHSFVEVLGRSFFLKLKAKI